MESHKNKQIITTIMVLVSVAIVVGGIILFNKKSKPAAASADSSTSPTISNNAVSTATPSSNPNTQSPSTAAPSSSTSSSYKDGSYTASADFYTPEETDTIKVTLAVKNGTVTGVNAATNTSSRESRQYDSAFLEAYKSYVVGKSLGGLNLNRVSGASLTTEGFNNALDTIRQQAQA